ncbi:hypothetical protein ACFU7T_36085 [Streptomyces sp. NPDC057555]|uniref:hypothetical protein n=1 Tax=Streptomyces sp. NPDC057555 TaxID=3346166 RepID=UPI003689516C
MEFREEWDQLVSSARQRSVNADQGTDQDVRMMLASVETTGSSGGGGSPDLKASQDPWISASSVANELQVSTGSALTRLNAAHEGIAWGLEGFMTPAVLNEVRTTWGERLEDVKAECQRLVGTLREAGKSFGEVDARTAQSFGKQYGHGGSKVGR